MYSSLSRADHIHWPGQAGTSSKIAALATSPTAGGWSTWSFQTDQPTVYVGNAWDRADTRVYCQPATPEQSQKDWRVLSSDTWFSGYWNGARGFVGGRYGSYMTNMRVYTERPNPDYDVGPRVIIREGE